MTVHRPACRQPLGAATRLPTWRFDLAWVVSPAGPPPSSSCSWSLGPIALIVIAAFTPERDIFAVGPSAGWRPTIENFVALWSRWGDFFAGLINSLIVTAGATVLAVLVSTFAGFGYFPVA